MTVLVWVVKSLSFCKLSTTICKMSGTEAQNLLRSDATVITIEEPESRTENPPPGNGSSIEIEQAPSVISMTAAADVHVPPPNSTVGPSRLVRFLKAFVRVFQLMGYGILKAIRNPRLTFDSWVNELSREMEFWANCGIGPIVVLFEMVFYWSNDRLSAQVIAQEFRSYWMLLKIALSILFVFWGLEYFFREWELFYLLVLMRSRISSWQYFIYMFGTVAYYDYMAKYLTILAKIVVVALPDWMIAYHKRDKVFHFLEISSQFYRTLLPIPLWIYYWVNWDRTEFYITGWKIKKVLGIGAAGFYLFCRWKNENNGIRKVFEDWKQALDIFVEKKEINNGHKFQIAPMEEVNEESCPICLDDFVRPILLECKHPFCEQCLANWFRRTRQKPKCPLCRARVNWPAKLKYWDGSTMALRILL